MVRRQAALSLVLGAALWSALVVACQETGAPATTARVQVRLTDASSELLQSARVWISQVYLVGSDEEDDRRVYLLDGRDDPRQYDLLHLRDGVIADLTAGRDVEARRYRQLRIVVDSAIITLADGYRFTDGTTTRRLQVPAGSAAGIRVLLQQPIDAEAGSSTLLVVDFDVDRNFVFPGGADSPAELQGVLFTPVLTEKNRVAVQVGGV